MGSEKKCNLAIDGYTGVIRRIHVVILVAKQLRSNVAKF